MTKLAGMCISDSYREVFRMLMNSMRTRALINFSFSNVATAIPNHVTLSSREVP
jgi:hypothetical protein